MMIRRLLGSGTIRSVRSVSRKIGGQRSLSSLSSTSFILSSSAPSLLSQSSCWRPSTTSANEVIDGLGPRRPHHRYFSRRPKDHLNDPAEEFFEFQESQKTKERSGTENLSAVDMEFFGAAGVGIGDDDDDSDDGNDGTATSKLHRMGYYDDDDEENEDNIDPLFSAEYRKKQEEIRKELDARTGRGWTDPWEIKEEQWMSSTLQEDLPDFSPELVSRISQERVQIYPGIPTLVDLAGMSLPDPPCPHPGLGQAKSYAKYRSRKHQEYIAEKVRGMAKDRVESIMNLSEWDDKQDAIDELFETIQLELKADEDILGLHPHFGRWVELGLEGYLRSVNAIGGTSSESPDESIGTKSGPVFMDCYDATDGEGVVVPSLLSPLKPHPNDGPGRMVEEWELSAHKKTKRILIRDTTKSIARILCDNDAPRIFVHGRKGVGKSAVLTSIVASARKSGNIVLYLPDGDRLRKNGFFITPNAKRDGMFDLQDLSQEACQQLLGRHTNDMAGMKADYATISQYFKDTQWKKAAENLNVSENEGTDLVSLLNYAMEHKNHAPMCYSVVVDSLIQQDDKPFLIVMDEFNCFFDRGHYFHMAYDEDVREPIPYDKINLFEHAMGLMALTATDEDDDDLQLSEHKSMTRGGIIVGTTESHAVRRIVTDRLISNATDRSTAEDTATAIHVVEVPRFSDIEVDHILANFEATGVGKLRLDRGETLMNQQEVEFLKMASGSIGQRLLDVSIM